MADIGLKAVMEMSGFSAGINKYNQMLGGASSGTEKHASIMSKALAGIGTVTKIAAGVAAAGLTAIVGGFAALASKAIPAASELNEAMNASSVVFQDAAKWVQEYGKTAAQTTGLSAAAFNQMAAQTGAMLTNFGLGVHEAAESTVALTERAADMASIFNTDVSEAMAAVQSGLRGQAEPLMRFGVDLSDAAVQAYALKVGLNKVGKEMDAETKSIARMDLLMEQTNKIAGDFVNTSDGMANAARIQKAEWQNFLATAGTQLLPVVQTMQSVFTSIASVALPLLLSAIKPVAEWLQKGASVIKDFVDGMKQGEGPIDALSTAIMKFFGTGIRFKFHEIATAVSEFATTVIDLVKAGNWGELGTMIADGVKTVWAKLSEWFLSIDWESLGRQIITGIDNAIKVGWPILKAQFEGLVGFIVTWFQSVDWPRLGKIIFEGIKGFIENTAWPFIKSAWDKISTFVVNWFNSVDWPELARIIFTAVKTWITQSAWPWIKTAFVNVKDSIVTWFKSVDWPELGRIIFTTLKTWITQSAWPWLKNAFVDVKDAIVAWFKTVDWGELGRILLEGVKKVIELAWDLTKGIGKALVDLGGKIIKWAQEYNWGALGLAIVNAIINAIKSGAGAIWNAILSAIGAGGGTGAGGGAGTSTGASGGRTRTPSGGRNMPTPEDFAAGQGFASLWGVMRNMMMQLTGTSNVGGFTSFAGAIMGRFQQRFTIPLEEKTLGLRDSLDALNELMLEGNLNTEEWQAAEMKRLALEKELAATSEELNIQKTREMELQKQLNDLSFLQAQMDFLAFLKENKLDFAAIMGDLQLGLDLDLPAFMDAISAALNSMVAAMNAQVGNGEAPEIPTGFAGQSFGKPMGGGGMQVYNNQQVNLYITASISNGMDLQAFDNHVLELVGNHL